MSRASEVEASPGDTLTIDAAGDEIMVAVLFLSMDDDVLELVPQTFSDGRPPEPFEKEDFINGEVFNNDTIADVIGHPLANGLPLFQLRYFEDVRPHLLVSHALRLARVFSLNFACVLWGVGCPPS